MKDRYSLTLSCAQLAKDRPGDIYLRLTNNIETPQKLTQLWGSTLRAPLPVGGRPAARDGAVNGGLTVGGV